MRLGDNWQDRGNIEKKQGWKLVTVTKKFAEYKTIRQNS